MGLRPTNGDQSLPCHSDQSLLRFNMESRFVGYLETDPARGGINPNDTRISAGNVRLLARHSVADEVVGRRLRHRGHGARFRGASAAWRRRAAG